jgi:LmbE family N-acetylglucosaminyl deacetylase
MVNGEDELWQPVHPHEQPVLEQLTQWCLDGVGPSDVLVSPLSLGNHVDHRLTRAAAERVAAQTGCDLWYYTDYPYAARSEAGWPGKIGEGWQKTCQAISPEALRAWKEAVACYRSQMSTFFKDRADLNASLENYLQTGGGACLWRPA